MIGNVNMMLEKGVKKARAGLNKHRYCMTLEEGDELRARGKVCCYARRILVSTKKHVMKGATNI